MSVYKNDVGVILRVTLVKTSTGAALDISGAATRQIILRKPSGGIATQTGVLTGDGSDGQMEYTTGAGTLDEAGNWKIQGYVELGGQELRSGIGYFSVGGILE